MSVGLLYNSLNFMAFKLKYSPQNSSFFDRLAESVTFRCICPLLQVVIKVIHRPSRQGRNSHLSAESVTFQAESVTFQPNQSPFRPNQSPSIFYKRLKNKLEMHSQFRNTIEHHKVHHEHQRNLWKKHYAYEVYTFQRHKPAGFAYSHLRRFPEKSFLC